MSALAPTLQAFFTDRLIAQRHASPHTISSYRDTIRLLLQFTQQRINTPPAQLDLHDLDAGVISAFLDHLEHTRHNTIGTRNARLAAIHSLYQFASLRHPEHAELIARVLAIPPKRHDRTLITHLTDPEIDALLNTPIAAPGSDGATERCCNSRSRPACASPSSPGSPSLTCTSLTPRTSPATAKAAKTESHH